jgi:hypothetical protein
MNVIMHTDEKIMAGRRAYIYNTTWPKYAVT